MAQDTFNPIFTLKTTANTQVLIGSGTTWPQFKTGGISVVLDNLAAANPALANPTVQPTGVFSNTGSLPAGTYYGQYTFVSPWGETAGIESNSVSVTTTGEITWTLPALPPGALSMNLYMTNGASGSEVLYASGITANSFVASYVFPSDVSGGSPVPTINTSGPEDINRTLRAIIGGHVSTELLFISWKEQISQYLSGLPVGKQYTFSFFNKLQGMTAAWYQIMGEIATLVWANQGTYGGYIDGGGMYHQKNTLP